MVSSENRGCYSISRAGAILLGKTNTPELTMAYEGTASFRGGPTIPSTGPAISTSAENRHVAVDVRDIRGVRDYLEKQGAELRKAVVIPPILLP